MLGAVRAPTLVLHREEMRDEAAFVAERVSGARRIEVEGLHDWFSWADPERNAILLRETHEPVVVLDRHDDLRHGGWILRVA